MSEPVAAPPITSISTPARRRKIKELVEIIREASDNITPWQRAKDEAYKELRPLLDQENVTRLAGDDWMIISMPGRKTLKAEKLLEQGVSMKIIERATVTGEPSYQVRKREEKEG